MKLHIDAPDTNSAIIGLQCCERHLAKIGRFPTWMLVETVGGKYDVAMRATKTGISIRVRPE